MGSIFGRQFELGRKLAARGSTRGERLVHAFWATLVAFGLSMAMLLEPVDWMIWQFQARISHHAPSGEYVYVQADSTLADPAVPARRAQLARALDSLRRQGAERVYLNVIFPHSETGRSADSQLDAALDAWGDRATFVDRIDIDPDRARTEVRSTAAFAKGRRTVWNGFAPGWPDFAWRLPYSYRTTDGVVPSLSADLARVAPGRMDSFEVDYGIRSYALPSMPLSRLTDPSPAANRDLRGKTVVIGTPRDPALPEMLVPGQVASPPSFVPIHAAETLDRGIPQFVSGVTAMGAIAVLLIVGAFANSRQRRRVAYGLAIAAPAYTALVAGHYGLRIELSYCLPLLAVFGFLRWRANWKRRIAQIDPTTGLPSFRALSHEIATAKDAGYVIVAKVHGYETILKSLEAAHRAGYMRKLVERIQVGDQRLSVFVDGHYLGWRVNLANEALLREHLEGLRAIFAAPVTVNTISIDVGITFGAAVVSSEQSERCIAAALAAVEETTEALEPIKIAEPVADSDALWDLSLRARIDEAMEAGEVFCVYQPKMDIAADRMIGVEALVRWEDPERGFIPPMHFVMQCEKAGRMEYLTRYVLQSACSAGKLLHFRGSRITMSVNISATLLSDMRIVGIVRNVLQATGFDPNFLVLEITETARIRDLTQARSVLKALKALGTHLSMDDFGVGSANFEALQALPFDEIKIDRQFVSRATKSAKARAITASIVGLGVSARIAVVAEGAETESDLQMLRDIGCWQVQGYALAKPMPLTNLLNFIDASQQGEHALTV